MSERVAILAGAGGELGRATALKLAAAGFTVVGIDRSEAGLNKRSERQPHEDHVQEGPGQHHATTIDPANPSR